MPCNLLANPCSFLASRFCNPRHLINQSERQRESSLQHQHRLLEAQDFVFRSVHFLLVNRVVFVVIFTDLIRETTNEDPRYLCQRAYQTSLVIIAYARELPERVVWFPPKILIYQFLYYWYFRVIFSLSIRLKENVIDFLKEHLQMQQFKGNAFMVCQR